MEACTQTRLSQLFSLTLGHWWLQCVLKWHRGNFHLFYFPHPSKETSPLRPSGWEPTFSGRWISWRSQLTALHFCTELKLILEEGQVMFFERTIWNSLICFLWISCCLSVCACQPWLCRDAPYSGGGQNREHEGHRGHEEKAMKCCK